MDTNNRRLNIVDGASCCVACLLTVASILLTGCHKKETKSYPQDGLTVEYSVDHDTIHVGDPVALIVSVYHPTNGVLKMPEIGREKDIVQLKRDWEDVPREDGLIQSEYRFSLTSFRLGDQVVSTNAIKCNIGDQTVTTNFPSVVLKVESSLPDDALTEIADIKPIQKLPGRIPRWIWIVLGSAAIAFLVGLITSKLWKHRETLIPAAPPVPPHVIALNALQALKNKGLLERGECNPFYTELSLILRTYLEGRFHLNAPDQTTEEIVVEMSGSPELSGAQRNILQEFMRQADMVKFAKGQPDRTTMEAAYNTTHRFVVETKQEQTNPTDQTNKTEPT